MDIYMIVTRQNTGRKECREQLMTFPSSYYRFQKELTCVKFPADILTNNLPKPAFIGSMDILIIFLRLECASLPFLSYLLETFFDFGKFMSSENATVMVGACEGNTTVNILTPKARVV